MAKRTIKQNRERQTKSNFRLTNRDKMALLNLAKTGRSTREILSKYGVNSKRITRMKREGLIKEEEIIINGKITQCLRLNMKKRKFFKANIDGINKFYKPAKQGTSHDVFLSQIFAEQLTYEQQLVARTELDITELFGNHIDGLYSPPDLYVPSIMTASGEILEERVVEVITKNYSEKDIEMKKAYCKELIGYSKEVEMINAR